MQDFPNLHFAFFAVSPPFTGKQLESKKTAADSGITAPEEVLKFRLAQAIRHTPPFWDTRCDRTGIEGDVTQQLRLDAIAADKTAYDAKTRFEKFAEFLTIRNNNLNVAPARDREVYYPALKRYEDLRDRRSKALWNLESERNDAISVHHNQQILELFQKACTFGWARPIHTAVYTSGYMWNSLNTPRAWSSDQAKENEFLIKGDMVGYALNLADKISQKSFGTFYARSTAPFPYGDLAPILQAGVSGRHHFHNALLPLVVIQIERDGETLGRIAKMEIPVAIEAVAKCLPDWTEFDTNSPAMRESIVTARMQLPKKLKAG